MARVTVEIREKGLRKALKQIDALADLVSKIDDSAGKSLKRQGSDVTKETHRQMKVAATATAVSIVPATAFDTGLARGNWEAKVQKSVPTGAEKDRLDSGPTVMAEMVSKIEASDLKQGQRIYITNGADHIEDLNTGDRFSKPPAFDVLAAQAGRRAVK